MLLSDMEPGQIGEIIKVSRGQQSERRLFEIGLVPGTKVEVLSRHPFKGPLLIKLAGTRIAVGRGIASAVEVKLA